VRGHLPMRKIMDILRLHFGGGLSNQRIADALKISKGSVFNVLQRFEASKLSWPLPEVLSQPELLLLLYPKKKSDPESTKAPLPDFDRLLTELARPHVTASLLFKEYRDANPDGLGRSRFYELLSEHGQKLNVTLRQTHEGGDKLFIDYSGDKPSYLDLQTGELVPVEMFVASWGASSFSYCEVTPSQKSVDFVQSHVRAFRFFGCVPMALVPDNLKSAVLKASFTDPDLNPLYARMAAHYDTAILPARPRKPRDKAVVESNVLHLQRFILGRLRDRLLFSLSEVQEAVLGLTAEFNGQDMQVFKTSRRERFETLDKPFAKPLPTEDFALQELKLDAKVHPDYHIQFRSHYYSVPYTLVGLTVDVHCDGKTVQLYHAGERIASHTLAPANFGHTTLAVHMPENHRFFRGLSPEKLIQRASLVGPKMTLLIEAVLLNKKHPEQGYRAALGLLDLVHRFGRARVENAAARALHFGMNRRRDLLSILDANLDKQPLSPEVAQTSLTLPPPPEHVHIRGAAYFKPNPK
jgi:transposase